MKTLYIFSLYTPVGQGEVFLKNEIDLWLKEKQINVIVVPTKIVIKKDSIIPEYVDVSLSCKLSNRFYKKFSLLLNPWNTIKCLRVIPKKYLFNLNVFRETLDALVEQKITKEWLDNLNIKNDTVFYSFWLSNSILSIAKSSKNKWGIKVISRAHRFDLYDYTQKYKFFPFRNKLISNLDLLMPASHEAKDYLEERFGNDVKVKLKKLGVNIPSEILTKKKIKTYRVVSCSYIREVKRVDLIARRLIDFCRNNPEFKIDWIHFGKGELESLVLKELENCPVNLTYTINDFTPNIELLDYYKNNWIDAFINLSSSEGQPVSIMEVMSYGVPCVATNTGGVSGLINNETGVLLDVDHKFFEFEMKFKKLLQNNTLDRFKIRQFIISNNSIEKQFKEIKEEVFS